MSSMRPEAGCGGGVVRLRRAVEFRAKLRTQKIMCNVEEAVQGTSRDQGLKDD